MIWQEFSLLLDKLNNGECTMKVKFQTLILGGMMAVLAAACAPDPLDDLTVEDTQVFITNYEPTTNFASYQTFSLADTVYVIRNQQTGVSTSSQDYQALDRVVSTLKQRGYSRVGRQAKPDLGVNIARISETQTGLVANYNPWNSYWGYGGGGFYYPPTYSYYQTTESYWYLEVVDLKNVTTGQQPKVVWNAQIRGNGIFDSASLTSLIDKVFTQSTYLKKN